MLLVTTTRTASFQARSYTCDPSDRSTAWLLSRPSAVPAAFVTPTHERVTFRNAANLTLVGTLALAAKGLSSLRLDFAGNGESEGTFYYGNMRSEAEDIRAAVLYLQSRGKTAKAVLGHSKGGSAVLLYAAKYDDIPRVVNVAGRFDCRRGFTERFGDDILERLEEEGQVEQDAQRFKWVLTKEDMQDRLSTNMDAAARGIKHSQVLTLHGSADATIPVEDALSFAERIARHTLYVVKAVVPDPSRAPGVQGMAAHAECHMSLQPRGANRNVSPFAAVQAAAAAGSSSANEDLMREARKSRVDALSGKLRCLGCGKVVPDYARLAQHLKDKHSGVNVLGGPGASASPSQGSQQEAGAPTSRTLTLADLLMATPPARQKRTAAGPSSAGPSTSRRPPEHMTIKDWRGVVQAFPDKTVLRDMVRGRLVGSSKKKLSRLKRVILRERADKNAATASAAAEKAAAAVAAARMRCKQLSQQLKAAEQALSQEGAPRAAEASVITQVQVLELAVAEAERRLQDAERDAAAAEAEAVERAQERARAWKLNAPGEDAAEAEAGARARPPSLPDQDAPDDAAAPDQDAGALVAAAEPSTSNETKTALVAGNGAANSAYPSGSSSADLGIQDTDTESIDGLDDFEDVLATWLHAAHSQAGIVFDAPMPDHDPDLPVSEAASGESDAESAFEFGEDVLARWMDAAGLLDIAAAIEDADVSSETPGETVAQQPQPAQHGAPSARNKQPSYAEPGKHSQVPHAQQQYNSKKYHRVLPTSQLQLSQSLPYLGEAHRDCERSATGSCRPSADLSMLGRYTAEPQPQDWHPAMLGFHPLSSPNGKEAQQGRPKQAGHGDVGGSGIASTSYPHEYECEVCHVVCCGHVNFEQHCTSKKHLRKAAAAAAAASLCPPMAPSSDGSEGAAMNGADPASTTTYVGIQAQCRNYCMQVISTELNRVVVEFLQQLLYWQERSRAHEPIKAQSKKRLVSGLREVAKAVRLSKAKTVVVAPNIEQIESEGGLDDLLTSILQQAEQNNIPIVFALSRKKLGQVFGCRKKMSAIAILDYSGAEAEYRTMTDLAIKGREDYARHHPEEVALHQQQRAQQRLVEQDREAQNGSSGTGPSTAAAPLLYRTRADGTRVPLTEGAGLEFARRKGLLPGSHAGGRAPANAAGAARGGPVVMPLHPQQAQQAPLQQNGAYQLQRALDQCQAECSMEEHLGWRESRVAAIRQAQAKLHEAMQHAGAPPTYNLQAHSGDLGGNFPSMDENESRQERQQLLASSLYLPPDPHAAAYHAAPINSHTHLGWHQAPRRPQAPAWQQLQHAGPAASAVPAAHLAAWQYEVQLPAQGQQFHEPQQQQQQAQAAHTFLQKQRQHDWTPSLRRW
ncbi:hypothetical protein WJX72_000039 [[Myrmecia] bisecta]|uniref:C2H2-type domain-containing protein n=1 Tax=[Myrmecia] bisecta TaxID=41462 RepID=A0AAW1PXD2_9CHLO